MGNFLEDLLGGGGKKSAPRNLILGFIGGGLPGLVEGAKRTVEEIAAAKQAKKARQKAKRAAKVARAAQKQTSLAGGEIPAFAEPSIKSAAAGKETKKERRQRKKDERLAKDVRNFQQGTVVVSGSEKPLGRAVGVPFKIAPISKTPEEVVALNRAALVDPLQRKAGGFLPQIARVLKEGVKKFAPGLAIESVVIDRFRQGIPRDVRGLPMGNGPRKTPTNGAFVGPRQTVGPTVAQSGRFAIDPNTGTLFNVLALMQRGIIPKPPFFKVDIARGIFVRIKPRRMNPMNTRALSRAFRRVDGATNVCKKVFKIQSMPGKVVRKGTRRRRKVC